MHALTGCQSSRSPLREASHARHETAMDEFVKLYHLPREAVLGYPETVYPEYRKKIKDTYVPPPPCTDSCGAAGNFVVKR